MSERLKGKHAILTGAAGGIGLTVAAAYLAQGARCTVADLGGQPTPELAALMAHHGWDSLGLYHNVSVLQALLSSDVIGQPLKWNLTASA